MGCYNYSNGLFEIQVKLPKNWVLITHLFFQCTGDLLKNPPQLQAYSPRLFFWRLNPAGQGSKLKCKLWSVLHGNERCNVPFAG